MHIDFSYLRALLLNYLVDTYYSISFAGSQPSYGRKPILIVRLDAIGDFILWLDSAKALREMYPSGQYRLILLGNALWIELAKLVPYFDEVLAIDRKRLSSDLRYRCSTWRVIKKIHYHLAINPVLSRDFNIDDSVIRVSGAKKRVGFAGDCINQPAWKKKISNRWYTKLIDVPDDKTLMELERNAHFIRRLGNESFRAGMPELVLDCLTGNRRADVDYIVVVPCASETVKQWPAEKYAELVSLIRKETRYSVLICGAPGEEKTADTIKQLVTRGSDERCLEVLTGRTSLMEYISIIKHARLVIGNDSSAIHVAAAVGTQSICIAGGGHFGRFVPYRLEKPTNLPIPVTVSHHMECFQCSYKDCKHIHEDGSAACLHHIDSHEVFTHIRALVG